MDNARFAALFAVMLGALAMVVNFIALPMFLNKVANIQVQMQTKMENFKNVADQAWTEMMVLRKMYADRIPRDTDFDSAAVPFPFGYNPPPEMLQQSLQKIDSKNITPITSTTSPTTLANPVLTTSSSLIPTVEPNNVCPPGPAGPPGEPGQDGMPGVAGADGLPGVNASEVKLFDEEMCLLCPKGPPGKPGGQGIRGVPGKPGLKGSVGKKGLDGDLGKAGPAGLRGISGIPGKNGTKGEPGRPAPGGKGDKGPKGARGPIGRAGPQGETGKPNFTNLGPGLQGLPGHNGENGTAGKTGPKGHVGAVGFVGMEGGYCPCPKELRQLGLQTGQTTQPPQPPPKDTADSSVAQSAVEDSKQIYTSFGSPPGVQPPAGAANSQSGSVNSLNLDTGAGAFGKNLVETH